VTYQWSFREWGKSRSPKDNPIELHADALLWPLVGAAKEPSVEGFMEYADQAYIGCRVLMLASEAVHPAALFLAGQVLEKYMKAILLSRGRTFKQVMAAARAPKELRIANGHYLEGLANGIGDEFADKEFIEVCRRLQPFETAGRYPDHSLDGWMYTLQLLTFLDEFVLHGRELIGRHPMHNYVREVAEQDTYPNPVMAAAVAALRDQNRQIDVLAAWEPATGITRRRLQEQIGRPVTDNAEPLDAIKP
jgi:HEPN domain-containing protein